MNLKEAAARLGVHYQTAYRWVRAGDLAAVRVGTRYELSDAAIHQFISARSSVLAQAVPRVAGPPGRSAPEDLDHALEDLEAMASDPLVTVPGLCNYAARLGSTSLGDFCVVAVTRADGSVEQSTLDHPRPDRAAFITAALDMTDPGRRRPSALLAPVLAERRSVRIPHMAQDRLRTTLRPELRQYLTDHPVFGLLAAPMTVADDAHGLVAFARDHPTRPYTAADEEFAQAFAARVGTLVVTAREIAEAWRVRQELADRLQARVDAGAFADPLDTAAAQEVLDAPDAPTMATLVFDVQGRILGANAAAERTGGYAPGALLGRSYAEVVGGDQIATERENLARLATGELDYHDFHAFRRRSDGSELDFAMHRAAVRRPDTSIACIVSVGRPVHLTARVKGLLA